MILADSFVWIDHLRKGDEDLARQLNLGRVLTHPFVIGELSLGTQQAVAGGKFKPWAVT